MFHAIVTDRQILVCLTTGKRNSKYGLQLTGQTIHRMREMRKDNRLTAKPRIKNFENGRNRNDGSLERSGGRHGGGGTTGLIADDDLIDAQESGGEGGGGPDV